MKIFYDLQLKLMHIITDNKKFGFFISGGLDSALLLYVACKIKQDFNLKNEYIIFTVPRYDDSIVHSKRIINYINSEFNINLQIIEVGDPSLEHEKQVLSGFLQASKLADIILLGDTTNPAHLPNGPKRIKSNNLKYVQPFFSYTKKETIALAIELNLIELMKISHTCTESKLLRCNDCWQCQERKWGFNVNDFVDPGTM